MSHVEVGMPAGTGRLSVPRHLPAPPGALTPAQHEVLTAVGDLLIPALGDNPSFAGAPGIQDRLRTAVAARGESFTLLTETLDGLAPVDDGLDGRLRALHAVGSERDQRFQLVSAVLAGAYLMVPEVRERIGYPGQHRDPAGIEEAADELGDGILDPVIERGPIWVDPDALATAPAPGPATEG